MRPVNQVALSLIATNRSPRGSSRSADSPPKPRKPDVRIRPLRNCSAPNWRWARSRRSKWSIWRARTSIERGAGGVSSSASTGLVCANARVGAKAVNPAAAPSDKPPASKWRRVVVAKSCAAAAARLSSVAVWSLCFPASPRGAFIGSSQPKSAHECRRRRRGPGVAAGVAVSLNSSASFSVMAPPSSSASTMVTARR